MTSVTIPSSMASMGEHVFANCSGLTSVTISEGVTNIGNQAFENCTGLRSVMIPPSVKNIGYAIFSGCYCPGLTIYGEKGSYAEKYAKNSNIRFSTGKAPQPSVKKDFLDSNVTVTLSQASYVYDGQAKMPTVTVKDGDAVLEKDVDYAVAYQDNTGVGEAKVIVTGQGNYTGTVTKTFTITEPEQKKTITDSNVTVTLSQTSYVYDGQTKMPTVTVKDGDAVLEKDVDYTVAYQDNTDVGEAKVIITGQGNYTGTVTKTFTITEPEKKEPEPQPEQPNTQPERPEPQPVEKKTLSSQDVTLGKTSYAYDGKAKKPAVTVKDGNKTLKAGTDYTVTYQNNKNVGKAKAVVKGIGDYQGTVTKTFTIAVKKNTSHKVGPYQYKVTGSSAVSLTAVKDSKVTRVKVPKTVKIGGKNFKVTAIGNNAFKKNKKITTVEIGDNVKVIGAGAFENCAKLSKVTVGKGVAEIGKNAFKNCKKLGNITIKSTKLKKVGANALRGIKSNAKIKVPAKKLSAYQKLFKNKGQGKKVKIVR